jgi:hypothetical protein
MTLINLAAYRAPPRPGPQDRPPRISVLIPARDEAANIGAALDAVLASVGVELEAVVLDDGSADATAGIVRARAALDPRVRLVEGAPLPPGWIGKPHACWGLAREALNPLLVFIDADVRLEPEALARIAAFMERGRLDLASGFPRQVALTLGEKLVIPQIMVLLLGYLPLPMARRSGAPGFAVGCGQLLAVRRAAYDAAGGHRAIGGLMHDGMALARAVRAAGGCTDICDLTALASCRMYSNWPDIWAGFLKNAREGMATPAALPVWTLLLAGGHLLPFAVVIAAGLAGNAAALASGLAAIALLLGARGAVAARFRQPPLSVLLHPLSVAVVLAIQWSALVGGRRRLPAVWRGRTYDV